MMRKNLLAAVSLGAFLLMAPSARADELAVPSGGQDGAVSEEEVFVYTIVPHDTLWDISERFLKNPFKWPRLWRLNPYIKNPHLIYPGNIVRITPDGIEIISRKDAGIEKLPVVSLEPEKERVVVLEPPVEPVAPPPPPSFASSDIPRAGFISDDDLDASGVLVGPREKKVMMNAGDEVYISLGKDAAAEGDGFSIFKVGDAIKHPVTGKRLGNVIDVLGSLTVTGSDGDVMVARVDSSFKEIEAGARLKPFMKPVTEVEITDPESEVEGFVVASLEHTENLSEANVVYIDRGMSDGVRAGNVMRVYREAEPVKDPANKGKMLALPDLELGKLIVVEAGERTSTAVVIESLRPIVWGDRVNTIPSAQVLGRK